MKIALHHQRDWTKLQCDYGKLACCLKSLQTVVSASFQAKCQIGLSLAWQAALQSLCQNASSSFTAMQTSFQMPSRIVFKFERAKMKTKHAKSLIASTLQIGICVWLMHFWLLAQIIGEMFGTCNNFPALIFVRTKQPLAIESFHAWNCQKKKLLLLFHSRCQVIAASMHWQK